MTDPLTDAYLDAIEQRANAATEGGWRAAVVARYVDDDGCERGKGGIYPAGPMGPPPLFVTPDWVAADAEFIADSRTALPKALAALEAVLVLHEPLDALNVRYNRIQRVCTGCGLDDGNWAIYPCPTVRAITKALGAES